MSVGMIILFIVLTVVAVIVGRVTASAKKRFGLKEAQAAASYIEGSHSSAYAIRGVVLGVLGYEDAVAKDVQALWSEKNRENAASTKTIEANAAEIERLISSNDGLRAEIAANEAELASAEEVAALFHG